MARMIPEIDPREIDNPGEQEVYRLLRNQLPDSWVVRHHFPACWLDGVHLRECECDFIVLAPGKGLMLLEVKSSHGYHSEAGKWFRVKPGGIRELTRNPFEQVSATKHKLVERISARVFHSSKHEFPGIFGHAVVYPFGRALGQLPGSTEPLLLFGYADMPRLGEKIDAALSLWGGADRGALFTPTAFQSVEKFLSEKSDLVTVLAAQVDQDERRIEDLTRRQFTAFRGILGHPRVHVTGTAGSGKTLIALWAAAALARAEPTGNKVLLLCFNRVLAAWLQSMRGNAGSLNVRSFFSLCREWSLPLEFLFLSPNTRRRSESSGVAQHPAYFARLLNHGDRR